MDARIQQIQEFKREKGFVNKDIAAALGININTVSSILNEKSKPFMIGKVYEFLNQAPPAYKLSKEDKASFIEEWNKKFNLKN